LSKSWRDRRASDSFTRITLSLGGGEQEREKERGRTRLLSFRIERAAKAKRGRIKVIGPLSFNPKGKEGALKHTYLVKN